MNVERIERELALLRLGGQECALFVDAPRPAVLYRNLPTRGRAMGLPDVVDVVVPVPSGHPAPPIDLAGLELGSALLPRVRGGQNIQGIISVDGRQWQLASYHPHSNGGGPPYDMLKHGFHTYVDHLLAWLDRLQ